MTRVVMRHAYFLKDIFSKPLVANTFSEKNLWKIFYYHGRNSLDDMINFQICRFKSVDKKLIKLKYFFQQKNRPIFPVNAKILIEKYKFKEGKVLGQKLKEIENIWVNNEFKISQNEIEKVVTN